MLKRTFIGYAIGLVTVVFTIIAANRGMSLYAHYIHEQRQQQGERLQKHFEHYQDSHFGYMPTDLRALAASEPLEPDLRALIQSGSVSYSAPTDYSWGYHWSLRIGQEYSIDCEAIP